MVDEALKKWVDTARQKGFSDEQIKTYLESKQYASTVIDDLVSTTKHARKLKQSLKLNKYIVFVVLAIAIISSAVVLFLSSHEDLPSSLEFSVEKTNTILQQSCSFTCCKDITCTDNLLETTDVCLNPSTEQSFCSNQKEMSISSTPSFIFLNTDYSFVHNEKTIIIHKKSSSATAVSVEILPFKEELHFSLGDAKQISLGANTRLNLVLNDFASSVPVFSVYIS